MIQRRISYASLLLSFLFATVSGFGQSENEPKEYGVFEYVVEAAQGSFEDVSNAIETGASQGGWRVLKKIDAGVPKNCDYHARVFVLSDPEYAKEIMQANRRTGPFAVVDRINLFEDENGIHVAVVNPHSINRTILMDDQQYEEMTENHLRALRKMITASVQGTESHKQYGQSRNKGHIGKTMGLMAGGKFVDQIEQLSVVHGSDLQAVASKVQAGLSVPGKKWGMHLVYTLELPEYDTVVFGTTGTPMDSKSFSIVEEGSDESRQKLTCPGLAHAAAYPIQIVVSKEGENIQVSVVEVMYRMKMYFEDAGKWAFMKNIKMPGSIQKELRKQVKKGLEAT